MTFYVAVTELIGPKYRVFGSVMWNITFSIGAVLLSGLAYAVRDFVELQLVLSAPAFITFVYWW